MSKKYWETDELASERAHWYEILREDGFLDLENPKNPDSYIQPEIISKKSSLAGGEEYHVYCHRILLNFLHSDECSPYISSEEIDRYSYDQIKDILKNEDVRSYTKFLIFELHADGTPDREIERILPQLGLRPFSQRHIGRLIQRMKTDFGGLDYATEI